MQATRADKVLFQLHSTPTTTTTVLPPCAELSRPISKPLTPVSSPFHSIRALNSPKGWLTSTTALRLRPALASGHDESRSQTYSLSGGREMHCLSVHLWPSKGPTAAGASSSSSSSFRPTIYSTSARVSRRGSRPAAETRQSPG